MATVIDKLAELKLIPVVKIVDAADTTALCEALLEGALPCAEFTFRTDAGPEAIRIAAARGDMLVGAGTVLTVDQVKKAVDNGAEFIVSPGFNPKVVGYCVENSIIIAPGTSCPTDIEAALGFGLDVVKFFPAEAFGGIKTLKAISGPYNMMRFIPTGGINAVNILEYLSLPQVIACGGSWMVKADLIADGEFAKIAALAREATDSIAQAG